MWVLTALGIMFIIFVAFVLFGLIVFGGMFLVDSVSMRETLDDMRGSIDDCIKWWKTRGEEEV